MKNLSFLSSPVFYDRKYFCSVLTDLSNLSFLFHQKFPLLSLKNVLTKQFPKMQKHPFANVIQNRRPIITRKYLCWSPFLIQLEAWRSATLLKKDPTQVFSRKYHKNFKDRFFMEHLRWLFLNMVEEFLRISYSS